MMNDRLKPYLAVVGDLPGIPSVASKVMTATADPNTSADDLRQVIETDPALAVRILKVANSSLYAFSRGIETLRHAIALLGFRTVENLVMAASLRDVFTNFGLSEKLLWEHSTLAGAVSARLSAYGPIDVDRESAFTAGLLHDLGKIALANSAREQYSKIIMRTYNEGIAFRDAEREEFGFDHAELGALVGEKWKLPERLVHAICYHHHDPADYPDGPPEAGRLIALTAVATRCCSRLGYGRREAIEAIDVMELPAWSHLDLGMADMDPILEIVEEEAKNAESLLA
ncbi:MAG: HDOD domain-containing protein [bacterium]|nr:HDOD domain-containing protein [bacterium]